MNLICTMVLGVLAAGDGRGELPITSLAQIKSPSPARVTTTLTFRTAHPFNPRFDQSLELTEQYGNTGSIRSAASRPLDFQAGIIMQSLFRDGERILCQQQYRNGERVRLSITFFSSKANPSISPPRAADIFVTGSFPVAGFIGGYSFGDYFPEGVVESSSNEHEVVVTASSPLGNAQAWLDPTRSGLVKRIRIEKSASHIAAGEQTIGQIQFQRDEPRSRLISSRIELLVDEYGTSASGEQYIRICRIAETSTSERGLEFQGDYQWQVTDYAAANESSGPEIFPPVAIDDRYSVSVKGAPQLPYVWSSAAQWAIPDLRFSMEARAGRPSSRFLVVLIVAITILFVGGLWTVWRLVVKKNY